MQYSRKPLTVFRPEAVGYNRSPMTQKQALDILKLGKNVFLTGAAGSGKTYVLNSYIHATILISEPHDQNILE